MGKRLLLFLLVVIAVFCGMVVLLLGNMEEEMKIYVKTKGNSALSLTLQNALYGHIQKENTRYVEVDKDASNRVTAIYIHSRPLSLLVSEMNLLLLKELEEFKSDGFGLPIGNLTSVAYLSGKGFKIPLTAEPLGTVAGEVRTDLIDAGINQTLHRVTLCFAVTVRYYSPLHEVADTLYFEVLIAETLVVGEVPIYKE